MRLAYFDCFSGISGDMILGALVDLGLQPNVLSSHLSKLSLGGYRIEVSREQRGPIAGSKVNVVVEGEHHPPRSAREISRLVAESKLPDPVKDRSMAVLQRLAEVEGHLHQHPPEEAHFHEVGAVDSIVDIVGACIGLHTLDIKKVIASPLPLARGFVHGQHGMLPLPAPATLALLKGVPVYDSAQQRELVTPTGAAVLTTITSEFGGFPQMRIGRVGYGVGQHPESHPPNLLRVVLGRTSTAVLKENLLLLETSIDDMNPELYGHLMERLFREGALDINVLPAQMKKNRPGHLLRVLTPEGLRDSVLQILFSETTSLGIRIHGVERISLPRTSIRVQTPYGRLPIKVSANPQGGTSLAPEYEACQRAAWKHQVPLRQVYEEAVRKARERLSRTDTGRRGRTTRGHEDTGQADSGTRRRGDAEQE